MDKLKEISFKDRKAIFDRLERIASQANLSKEEREEGRIEEKLQNARNLKGLGVSTEIIMKATGLTAEEIEQL